MMPRSFMAAIVFALLNLPHTGNAAQSPAPAATLAVERVLSPAWIERADGRREPLRAGTVLTNKDKVHTGDGGRALLRMAEGSTVKLGDASTVLVDGLTGGGDPRKGGAVSASLDVVRGAFRFTTALLAKSSAERDVRIKVNAITAGIRGTDVWGKAESERDIICLLEGRISVSHGVAQFVMQDPNSFYIAPRTGQAQPPSPVSAEQVREWSSETEIDARSGAVSTGGNFSVTVAPAAVERTANALRDKLRDSGFPAEVVSISAGMHEVRISSLAENADAAALAQRLRAIGFREARPSQ